MQERDMACNLYTEFDFNLLDTPDFKEDSVREELILPFLTKLNYKAIGRNKILRSKTLQHPFVQTGSSKRKINSIPDYLFEVNGRYAWVLDAKSPGEEIKSGENREQAYFYAIHPEIRVGYYGLCNGREFVLFKTDGDKPALNFHLNEIEKHWDKIKGLLSPDAFVQKAILTQPEKTTKEEFDYDKVQPPKAVVVRKQEAKRHFGVHGYFTKQAWNVVEHYIKNFTKPGDVVLDPFGGSGVTLVEALMLGRKAIHIDINPLAIFMVENLISPINIGELLKCFEKIKKEFVTKIPKTKKEIEQALKTYSYPKGVKLPENSDVETLDKIFTPEQLAQLAYLKHLIKRVKGEDIRGVLLLMFSGLLNKINLTYHSSSGRSAGRGNSSMFAYYRYRIAPDPAKVEVMDYFESRLKKVLAAKKELAANINKQTISDADIYKGSATDLNKIANESVDYIYTDPPYGKKIQYLDLSVMWNAWLDLKVTREDYELEAIEGGSHKKTSENYSQLLAKSIQEMYRVLKYDRWMSFVFAHKDPKYWHLIIDTAEKVGFEYAGAVAQNNGQSSFKKRQNPFSVLSGQLIINFRKVRSPQAIQKVRLVQIYTT